MTQPRILVLGSDGQVGFQLMRTLAPLGEVTGSRLEGASGLRIDVTDLASLEGAFVALRPHLVVNAVAYTAVDRAEEEPALATAINATAAGVLGELAARHGAAVVHFSTDYVYSGQTDRPWREDDPVGPRNVYGRTKLAGDEALLASGAESLILRTSWVYDRRGRNFLLTMRRLMAEREEVRVVADQIGAPTWARLIAQATALVLAQTAHDGFRFGERGGVYHLTCGGSTSWHGFAEAIRDLSGAHCRVIPVTTADYPLPAPRPADSRLDNAKLEAVFGVRLPDWHDALRLCLEENGGA
jgi:dTDP-4-dehydrorhamnose reductase